MSMNKEQQLFKQTMLGYEDYEEEHFELDRYGNFSWIGTADHFDIWQLCAKAKQAEIDELKAQVAQAVPEGFVLMPKEPNFEMVMAGKNIGDANSCYKSMIEAWEQSNDKN